MRNEFAQIIREYRTCPERSSVEFVRGYVNALIAYAKLNEDDHTYWQVIRIWKRVRDA